jgi:haloalkane dehalogenase
MKKVLRTPPGRFDGLPDYPFDPHFATVQHPKLGELAMHYVDEGPDDRPVALLLHGEPTWSYVYRNVIPVLANAGYRVIAPDCIGFGKSDKLPRRENYTVALHVEWLAALVEQLELRDIVLVCQDWGGPIGLRVLASMPERFAAVVAANTLLPNCEDPPNGIAGWPGQLVEDWVEMVRGMEDIAVGETVAGVCLRRPPDAVVQAYDAPFPGPEFKSGVLAFPLLIPLSEEMVGCEENRQVWHELERFDKPFITAFSDSDPSTSAWAEVFRRRIPGARGRKEITIANAGHFLQEEQPAALTAAVLDVLRSIAAGG